MCRLNGKQEKGTKIGIEGKGREEDGVEVEAKAKAKAKAGGKRM